MNSNYPKTETNPTTFADFLALKPNIKENTAEQYRFALTKSYISCGFKDNGSCDCFADLLWISKHHVAIYDEFEPRLSLSTLRTRTNQYREICCQMGYNDAYAFFSKKTRSAFERLKAVTNEQKR